LILLRLVFGPLNVVEGLKRTYQIVRFGCSLVSKKSPVTFVWSDSTVESRVLDEGEDASVHFTIEQSR